MAKTARIGTDERTRVMSPDIHDILHEKDTNDTHDTHDTQKNDSFLVRGGLGVTRARRMTDSSARASDGASGDEKRKKRASDGGLGDAFGPARFGSEADDWEL